MPGLRLLNALGTASGAASRPPSSTVSPRTRAWCASGRHDRVRWAGFVTAALVAIAGPAAAAEPWGFLVAEGGQTRLPLEGAEVVVGSAEGAGARIADATVSPRHAVLRFRAGEVTIADAGSKHGTLVAGTELRRGKPMRLVQDTLLTFGASSWTFTWGKRDLIPPTQTAAQATSRAVGKGRSGAPKVTVAKPGKGSKAGKGSKGAPVRPRPAGSK